MKKFIFSQIVLCICVFPVFSQTGQMLDEQVTQVIRQKLPQWKPQNPLAPFDFISGEYLPVIESEWTFERKKVTIRIWLLKSDEELNKYFKNFLILRQVGMPNRKIENLGDRAHLIETARRVEVEFSKANVYIVINTEFPDTREDKKSPYYYAHAPKEEVEGALNFAQVVAAAFDGKKSISPCFNNFYRQKFPESEKPEDKLFAAIKNGQAEVVKSLIGKNANLKHVSFDGRTPLHLAVEQGCSQTVKTLISAKADLNSKDEKGATPLMMAAKYGDFELAELLLSAGAEIQTRDLYGRNAMFFVISPDQGIRPGNGPAPIEQKSAIIKYLVTHGLKLNEKDGLDNNTPLTALLQNCSGIPNCKAVMSLFLDLGANINEPDKNGETALFKAVSRINFSESKEFIELLISRGADVNYKTNSNETALSYLESRKPLYSNDAGGTVKFINDIITILKSAGATG